MHLTLHVILTFLICETNSAQSMMILKVDSLCHLLESSSALQKLVSPLRI